MSVVVLSGGLATTVQDGGRRGWARFGISRAGALDPWSFALANLLAGNPPDAPALELSFVGPHLRFERAVRIALCGAPMPAEADGMEIPYGRRVELPAGCVLRIGGCRGGARAYLAVAGGFAVPWCLGSASTDLRGGFGGYEGRPLCQGDRLALASPPVLQVERPAVSRWWVDTRPDDGPAGGIARIRVLPGSEDTLPPGALLSREWEVSAASNRQGLRLLGTPLAADAAGDAASEPVVPGTIQLPPDGRPIVLLADAQTHGGYPRIGHAIRADWPRLAQLRPGARLRFVACTPEQAHAALCRQRERLHRIAVALAARGE